MIDLILSKDFVLDQAQLVLEELEAPSVEKGAAKQIEEDEQRLEEGPELEELKAALANAIEEESMVGTLVANRKAYVPQNAVLSVLQTVMEEQIRELRPDRLRDAKPFSDGGPLTTQIFEVRADDPDQFTHKDPRWVTEVAKALWRRVRRGRYRFVGTVPPPEFELDEKARIILLGDWGTHNASARTVGDLVRKELEDAESDGTQGHLIHLGDVYYSGETQEAQERLLDPWPIKTSDANRWYSWALNGNHDMYSGGHGYFDTILGDPRFAGQRTDDDRPCSFFRLHSKHWQLLGLDSAWDEHWWDRGRHGYLKDPQGAWVLSCVQNAQGRGTILLTHHQYLTTHEHPGGNFPSKLKPTFEAGGVNSWFWGHEHRCMTFYPRPQCRYGACVGHGGMPEPVGHSKPEVGEWEYDLGHADADGDQWRWCGFAVLDMDGDEIKVRYIDEVGNTHHPHTLPAP